MKALQYAAVGAEPEVREIPTPEPGPGQVLLKITAAGVCHSDDFVMSLPAEALTFPLPLTLGHEGAGTVAALGGRRHRARRGGGGRRLRPMGVRHLLVLLPGRRELLFPRRRTRHLPTRPRRARRHRRIPDRRLRPPPGPDRRPRPGRDGAAHRRRPHPLPRHQTLANQARARHLRGRDRQRGTRACRHPVAAPPLTGPRDRPRRHRRQTRLRQIRRRPRSGTVRRRSRRQRPRHHRTGRLQPSCWTSSATNPPSTPPWPSQAWPPTSPSSASATDKPPPASASVSAPTKPPSPHRTGAPATN